MKWLPLLGLLCALLLPRTAAALEDSDILLLPIAGVDRAPIYSLTNIGGQQVGRRSGRVPIVSGPAAPAAFGDLKKLVGGNHLLADFDARGAAITAADGEPIFSLDEPGALDDVASASAAGYAPDGRLTRILLAENSTQRIAIYDRGLGQYLWTRQLVLPPVRADIVQAIALPDHRIALAANWPTLGLSAIDVFRLDEESAAFQRIRFANKSHSDEPRNFVVLPDIEQVRDVFGLSDGRLLVTTAQKLLILSTSEMDGKIEASFSLGDSDELAGEWISARQLPSGQIAAATVEPGLWTQPHPNHRVVWLSSDLGDVEAVSPALERAPWRVEAALGHGGSGTLGFEPTLEFLPTGTIDDLQAPGRIELEPVPVRLGSPGSLGITLTAASQHPIVVPSVTVRAAPGSCEALEDGSGARTLAEWTDVIVGVGRPRPLDGSYRLEDDQPVGEWCARVHVQGRGSDSRTIGAGTRFRVVGGQNDAGGSGGSGVDPVDLELRAYAERPDAGVEPISPSYDPDEPPEGCGCRTTSETPGRDAVPGLLFALCCVVFRKRRTS